MTIQLPVTTTTISDPSDAGDGRFIKQDSGGGGVKVDVVGNSDGDAYADDTGWEVFDENDIIKAEEGVDGKETSVEVGINEVIKE